MEPTLKFIFKLWRCTHLTLCFFLFTLSCGLFADEAQEEHGTGLIPLDSIQWEELDKNTLKIIGVNPNKIGSARIQEHLEASGQLPKALIIANTFEEEFITTLDWDDEYLNNAKATVGALPSAVDNSKLACFPPVGNQGSLGSCVGWASTYYGGTHELGLLNGYNNKSSSNNILSPKWTYNMVNQGMDFGTTINSGYDLLEKNGAVSIIKFPYDTNYREWDLNQQDWITAISSRMQPLQMIPGLGKDISVLKALLNNGHIVSIGTWVYSWVLTTIKADPSNPNSPYVGQVACRYMNGRNGGHNISIVGYDDNIWIDVNENGQVDPGERGAFLLCNSWGTNWGNQGFIWVSYDAFSAISSVPNGPSDGRVAISADWNNMAFTQVPKTANYRPNLIGIFTLAQNLRNQIGIRGGIAPLNAPSPTTFFQSVALNNSGGAFAFNGTNTTTTGNFALDFTDLIPAQTGSPNPMQYMLEVTDIAAGNPTQVSSFTLIDNAHNITLPSNQNLIADNSKIYSVINYDYYNQKIPDRTAPQIAITSPISGGTVQGTIQVVVNATDNIGVNRVEFFLDNNLVYTDNTLPYMFILNTTTLTNGSHQVKAIAYDDAGNSATSAININVQNVVLPTSYHINAGGSTFNLAGVVWQNDAPFISGGNSAVYTNNSVTFSNPIYNTERFGKKLVYNFPVQNGKYKVILKFAEIYWTAPNKRLFNVSVNGLSLYKSLDLFARVGYGRTFDVTITVDENNNNIQIVLDTVLDNAKISGIEINKI